ncbi:MAG: acylphosphatase, partial [Kiritimatiellia bacterium]
MKCDDGELVMEGGRPDRRGVASQKIPVNTKRIRIQVTGRVQGVGFRPTVYRQAVALGLAGFVRNTPSGVAIEVEGEVAAVDRFVVQLQAEPPRQARIATLQVNGMPVLGEHAPFEIKASGQPGDCRSGDLRAGMPPD